MDHMHISGTEPLSMVFGKKSSFMTWKVMPLNFQNKLKPKGMVQ